MTYKDYQDTDLRVFTRSSLLGLDAKAYLDLKAKQKAIRDEHRGYMLCVFVVICVFVACLVL